MYTPAGNIGNYNNPNSYPWQNGWQSTHDQICPSCGYCPTCGQRKPRTYGGGIIGGFPNAQTTIGGTAQGISGQVNAGSITGPLGSTFNGEGNAISKGNVELSCCESQDNG